MDLSISLQIVRGIARAVAGSGLSIKGSSAQDAHEVTKIRRDGNPQHQQI